MSRRALRDFQVTVTVDTSDGVERAMFVLDYEDDEDTPAKVLARAKEWVAKELSSLDT